jgi:arsenate reductase
VTATQDNHRYQGTGSNKRFHVWSNLSSSASDPSIALSAQAQVNETNSSTKAIMNTTGIIIYHNPACGTSRNTLALIRNAGIEPQVIDYLQHPPTREQLASMISEAGLTVREAIREKGTPFIELGLNDPAKTDAQLLDAMLAHPILINRPFVVTPLGVRLCRPSELVLDILPQGQQGAFNKEDGEAVIDAAGKKVLP